LWIGFRCLDCEQFLSDDYFFPNDLKVSNTHDAYFREEIDNCVTTSGVEHPYFFHGLHVPVWLDGEVIEQLAPRSRIGCAAVENPAIANGTA
jgi:hypothetical protein